MSLPVIIFMILMILLLILLGLGADPVKVGTALLVSIAVLVLFGVETVEIVTGILMIVMLLLGLMFLFFFICLILFLIFRSGRAVYEDISPFGEGQAGFARYTIGAETFYCIYPIEMLIVNYLYPGSAEPVRVRFLRTKRRNILFDRYSCIVMSVGLIASAVFGVLLWSLLLAVL